MNSMRVTVPSRQFVTQEIESESVTLRLRPGGGVEEREEECQATVRIPQPRGASEERRRSRKRGVRTGEEQRSKRWRMDSEEE